MFKNQPIVVKDGVETMVCENNVLDYMREFIDASMGKETDMKTSDVLKSQRQVLEIQKYADKNL